MRKLLIGAAVLTGGTAAICTAGAMTLFERVIPRQNELRVDINEMADMKKWEEYKKSSHRIVNGLKSRSSYTKT